MADNRPRENIGFASLAWRVDDLPNVLWLREPAPADEGAADASASPSAAGKGRTPRFDDGSYPAPRKKMGLESVLMIGASVVVVGIIVWAKIDHSSSEAGPSHGAAAPRVESPQLEQIPPTGKDNVLTVPQIRFCTFEKVRLETMQPLIQNRVATAKFNDRVEQYNARCSSYRYPAGAVQTVHDQLAGMKSKLDDEARKAVAGWNEEFDAWVLVRPYRNLPFSYKFSSVERSKNMARAEFMWNETLEKQTPKGLPYKSVKMLRYFNCVDKTFGTSEARYFSDVSGSGEMLESTPVVAPERINLEPISPGSAALEQMKVACVSH